MLVSVGNQYSFYHRLVGALWLVLMTRAYKENLELSTHNQRVGKWGERLAAVYLMEKGYEIMESNYRTPYGELDLVANHDGQLIIIEVKPRSHSNAGYPEDALTPRKVEHLINSAQYYLEKHPESTNEWKIEIVAIIGRSDQYEIKLFDEVSYA
jgi:putative endonuclease